MIYVAKNKDSKEEIGREVCRCCGLPVVSIELTDININNFGSFYNGEIKNLRVRVNDVHREIKIKFYKE